VFVFTYRPVEKDHPFHRLIDFLNERALNLTNIRLQGLRQDVVYELVAHILDEHRLNRSLSDFLCRVANGNALFIRQQLISLFDNGLLSFDGNEWTCDIEKVEETGTLVEDIVGVVLDKIKRLPSLTQHTLMICSCIGSKVDLDILSLLVRTVYPTDSDDDAALARKAISECIIEGLLVETEGDKGVAFIHDSVQSAAYSLLPGDKRAAFHLKLGQLLQTNLSADSFQKHLFQVTSQLARGYELIPEDDRIATAKIFLRAGDDSQLVAAFPEAHFFYARGIAMLCNQDWMYNYRLSFDLYMKASEVAIITKAYKDVDQWIELVLLRTSSSPEDNIRAIHLKARTLAVREDFEGAVKLALKALSAVGVKIPTRNLAMHTMVGLARTRYLMKGKTSAKLLQRPDIVNKEVNAVLRLLGYLATITATGRPKLLPLITFRILYLNLKYGISPTMAPAIAWYGFIISLLGFPPSESTKFGDLALSIQESLECDETRAQVLFLCYGSIFPCTKNLSECIPSLYDGHKAGLHGGDLPHAMVCAYFHGYLAFHSGQQLSQQIISLENFSRAMSEYNSTTLLRANQGYQQAVVNFIGLSGQGRNRAMLKGDVFNIESACNRDNAFLNEHMATLQLVLACMLGQYELSWITSEELQRLDARLESFIFYIEAFFRGLTACSLYQSSKNQFFLKSGKTCLRTLKNGMKRSPATLSMYLSLLEAEIATLESKYKTAEKCFSMAIEQSASARVLHIAALAHDRFGRYYLLRENNDSGYEQLRKACDLYLEWGSRPKVKMLKKEFPSLIDAERRDTNL